MLQLGKKQTLKIVKKVDFGVYLAEEMNAGEKERVLLPGKQVPREAGMGDEIKVFLYRDSKDRMIATTREPLLELGKTALLKVVETGKIGAFWIGGWRRIFFFLSGSRQETFLREMKCWQLFIWIKASGCARP